MSDFEIDEYSDEQDLGPSKSARKREAHKVLAFARELVEARPSKLADMPIPAHIHELIEQTRRIRAHGARKRQLSFLAKHMRELPEEELTDMMEHADRQAQALQRENARLHLMEAWRDALLSNPEALTQIMDAVAEQHRGELSQLVRQARRQHEKGEKRAPRLLFKLLRELDAQAPLPNPPAND
jgi:ribosome-associated protein